jgi:hypothetical protein
MLSSFQSSLMWIRTTKSNIKFKMPRKTSKILGAWPGIGLELRLIVYNVRRVGKSFSTNSPMAFGFAGDATLYSLDLASVRMGGIFTLGYISSQAAQTFMAFEPHGVLAGCTMDCSAVEEEGEGCQSSV